MGVMEALASFRVLQANSAAKRRRSVVLRMVYSLLVIGYWLLVIGVFQAEIRLRD
jgi:hypothetical protein